jgi:hypothetical protein
MRVALTRPRLRGGQSWGRGATAFAALPHDTLPRSAGVDFLHLLVSRKPAVRFKLTDHGSTAISGWCHAHGYACRVDDEGYCCVARTASFAEHVLEVDRRSEPHELELGLLLGYPRCCADVVALIGESAIDEHALVVAAWTYEKGFRSIDPSGYRSGTSLICHLPCCPTCLPSLEIASSAARFLTTRSYCGPFERWSRWAYTPLNDCRSNIPTLLDAPTRDCLPE